jgi:short-subunit dehydrogenase
VKSLTEGLAVELDGTGVRTSALCPGHVQTGFQVAAGFSDGAMAVPGELSAAVTVAAGLRGYERGKTIVVPGFMNKLAVFFGGLLPRSWVARISARTLQKLGRFD